MAHHHPPKQIVRRRRGLDLRRLWTHTFGPRERAFCRFMAGYRAPDHDVAVTLENGLDRIGDPPIYSVPGLRRRDDQLSLTPEGVAWVTHMVSLDLNGQRPTQSPPAPVAQPSDPVGRRDPRALWITLAAQSKEALCLLAGYTVPGDPLSYPDPAAALRGLDLPGVERVGEGFVNLSDAGAWWVHAMIQADTARVAPHVRQWPQPTTPPASDPRVVITPMGALWWPACPKPNGYNWVRATADRGRLFVGSRLTTFLRERLASHEAVTS